MSHAPRPRMASAGFGVRRGRLPGATDEAWPGTAQDWQPRDDGQKPRPGITGLSQLASLGVAETALPWRSTTHTYEVSPGSSGPAPATTGSPAGRATGGAPPPLKPPTAPAGGSTGHARPSRITRRRSAA